MFDNFSESGLKKNCSNPNHNLEIRRRRCFVFCYYLDNVNGIEFVIFWCEWELVKRDR
jgi:hypothetical protein